MDNSRYNAVMREYDGIRYANHRIQDERKEEIYSRYPEIRQFDKEISQASMDTFRQSIQLPDDKYRQLQEELNVKLTDISAKKNAFLIKKGYPSDYLEPVYTCSLCHDTGYIGNNKCICFKQIASRLFMQEDRVRAMPAKAIFKNFNLNIFSNEATHNNISARQSATLARDRALAFVTDFDAGMKNLLISGTTGTGKTFLAGCIAHSLIESGHSVAFVTAFNFFDILQKYTFSKKDTDENDLTLADYFLDCDLLILDDLGTELTNAFTAGRLFTYLNERLVRQKSTIISTNFTMREIRNVYSERVFSRLAGDYDMISLTGNDIRTGAPEM